MIKSQTPNQPEKITYCKTARAKIMHSTPNTLELEEQSEFSEREFEDEGVKILITPRDEYYASNDKSYEIDDLNFAQGNNKSIPFNLKNFGGNEEFERNLTTPISKIEFAKSNFKEKSKSEDSYPELLHTPVKSETDASNFISPYTSQLLKQNPKNISISNSKFNLQREHKREFNLNLNTEIDIGFSEDFSPGPLTKSKIKSLMRDDTQRSQRNTTPEDGIVGADTLSFVNQSQIQENWKAMERESTENDYILRRTHSNFYCNQDSSLDHPNSSIYYESSSFATFINICEQKVKKMVRLNIEKKINFTQLRGNFNIDKNPRYRKQVRERRAVQAVCDNMIDIEKFQASEEEEAKKPVYSRKSKVFQLKRGERSMQCSAKITMYGFKKPAQIFTSFNKRRGFCSRSKVDFPSRIEENPFESEKRIELSDSSPKKVRSRLRCERQKRKLVKFLKDKISTDKRTLTSREKRKKNFKNNRRFKKNKDRDSFKENRDCYLQNSYRNLSSQKPTYSSISTFQSQVMRNTELSKSKDLKRKVNFRSNTKKKSRLKFNPRNNEKNKNYCKININKESKNFSLGELTDMRSSPSNSNFENDNKKYRRATENNTNNHSISKGRTSLNKNKDKVRKLYKVQSSMLVKAKQSTKGSGCSKGYNVSIRDLKSLNNYSSTNNLKNVNSSKKKSFLKMSKKNKNFLERRTKRGTYTGSISSNLRRSSFLNSMDRIGADKKIEKLSSSIRRLETSMSKSPKKRSSDKMLIKNGISNNKRKKGRVKSRILSHNVSQGFLSNREQVSFYEVNIENFDSKKKKITMKKDLSFRRKKITNEKVYRGCSPRGLGNRNFFDSDRKNSGGKVFVGDRYVNVKDIVKYHLNEGVTGRKFAGMKKKSSSSLLDKISKLKSFRKGN